MRNRSQGCQPFPLVVLGWISLKWCLYLLVTGAGGAAPHTAAPLLNAQGSSSWALPLQPSDGPEVKLHVIFVKKTSPPVGQNFPLADQVHAGPFTQPSTACDACSRVTSRFPHSGLGRKSSVGRLGGQRGGKSESWNTVLDTVCQRTP